MDFRLTTEQQLYKQSIREWLVKNLEPRARAIDEAEDGIPDDITAGMAELGMFGVTIPEEFGGCAVPGEEPVYGMLTIHEIARADLSMSTPVYTLLTIGWAYIVNKYGTQKLKELVLPKIAAGKLFAGINTTEPGGGSDLANIKTTAVRKGDKFILNGEKAYVSGPKECIKWGSPSGHCTLVRTDPSKGNKGMTFMWVDASLPGVSYSVYKDMGRMGLSTGGWIYKDVEIPEWCVLGEVDRGFYVNMDGFNAARVLVAAACLGGAEKALEISAEYTAQRMVFGKPLGKFEGISFEMANDWMLLDMLKLNLTRGAWMIGYESQNPGTFSRKDINKVISTCKCLSPTLGHDIARHGMIYHGGFGYTKDTPLEMLLRGVMSYEVGAEGGLNIMRGIIARDEWGEAHNPFHDRW
ncbi:MAG: acyl-CoA/acyl-ACP dehydrogenase [Actinobacteria bacterium]|jgi:acyl-CoA dehydrogenase|nr:acyl-CoA/acyl-ACP dehydrogenase [Actinomycetota bacterium]